MTASMRRKRSSALKISGEMTAYRAVELKQALLAQLERPAPVAVDLSGVTDIDCAGVQLLLLARKCAQAAGKELLLQSLSVPISEVFELLNLHRFFDTAATAGTTTAERAAA